MTQTIQELGRYDAHLDRFICAACDGKLKKLQKMIAAGISPAAQHNIALRKAAEHGHLKMVKFLLADPCVDPNAKNGEALRKALRNQHTDIVQVLNKFQN